MAAKIHPGPMVDASPPGDSPPGTGARKSCTVDFSKASREELDNDPLLQQLKTWDKNGDGVFSTAEIMQAAKELSRMKEDKKHSQLMARRLAMVVGLLGLLLLLSMIGNFCSTVYAIKMSKEEEVPQNSGVMITAASRATTSETNAPKPVGTSAIREQAQGLSGLKEASKEELDRLEELSFFHDGGYHRMKVAQVHRYDGRVEVWASPVGIVVVEDTGEVHYAPFGVPGSTFDGCWGENATETNESVCGEGVDNEPPNDLEVEDPVLQDADNAPAPSPNDTMASAMAASGGRRLVAVGTDGEGEEILRELSEEATEASAHARRLSGRRRSLGSSPRRRSGSSSSSWSLSSSRRRSGAAFSGSFASSRRRSFGSVVSSASVSASADMRRRAPVAAVEGRRRVAVPASSADTSRRRGLIKQDGSSRRRATDYYGTADVRRRAVGAVGSHAAAGAVGAGAGYAASSYFDDVRRRRTPYYVENNYQSPSSVQIVCEPGKVRTCSNNYCYCEEAAWPSMIVFIVLAVLVFCLCCAFATCVIIQHNKS